MSMTKTDYLVVADSVKMELAYYTEAMEAQRLLKNEREFDAVKNIRYGVITLASTLAASFKNTNSKFDRNKFMGSCGIEVGK